MLFQSQYANTRIEIQATLDRRLSKRLFIVCSPELKTNSCGFIDFNPLLVFDSATGDSLD